MSPRHDMFGNMQRSKLFHRLRCLGFSRAEADWCKSRRWSHDARERYRGLTAAQFVAAIRLEVMSEPAHMKLTFTHGAFAGMQAAVSAQLLQDVNRSTVLTTMLPLPANVGAGGCVTWRQLAGKEEEK